MKTPIVSSSPITVDSPPAIFPNEFVLKYPIFTFFKRSPIYNLFSAPKLYEAIYLFLSARYPNTIFPIILITEITKTVYTSFISTLSPVNIFSQILVKQNKIAPKAMPSNIPLNTSKINIRVILFEYEPETSYRVFINSITLYHLDSLRFCIYIPHFFIFSVQFKQFFMRSLFYHPSVIYNNNFIRIYYCR